MPRQTDNYKLGYFVAGELTDATTEERRFRTLDLQLRAMFEMIGNGVQSGWDINISTENSFSVIVGPGRGIVSFLAVESTASNTLGPFSEEVTMYIYAIPTTNSAWNGSVNFVAYTSGGDRSDALYVGSVTTGTSGVLTIDVSERNYIGFLDSIRALVESHKHTGVGDNPDPVDLATEVTGQLSQESIPELSANKVSTGVLDKDRIPLIDHHDGLTNRGSITHAQIDSFLKILLEEQSEFLGETLLVNFLQLVMALKHQWPDVDEFLYNTLAFIPGISPDSLIDDENTTALVDTRAYEDGGEHRIYGTPGTSYESFIKTWSNQEDLEEGKGEHVVISQDNVRLASSVTNAYVDDFENVSDWDINILDLSSGTEGFFDLDSVNKLQGIFSGKVDVGGDSTTNLVLLLEKKFTAQDWSSYNKIVFHFFCDNPQHGNIYFYVNDADNGVQTSTTLVLERGAVTINQETLMVGWKEYVVDISELDRRTIDSIGFYTSTQQGWDANKKMIFNIDQMYITTGNKFFDNGYIRFIYGDSIPKDYYRIKWESLDPSNTLIQIRTRLANTTDAFDPSATDQPPWSNLLIDGTKEGAIVNVAEKLYKYAEIEVYFETSQNNLSSPELFKLHLLGRNVANLTKFTYDTKDEWESGTLVDVDTVSQEGAITLARTQDLYNIFAASNQRVIVMDDEYKEILSFAGSLMPRSTIQILNDDPPSFGQISGIDLGEDGSFWVADSENDRVLNIDRSGNLVVGFYGSFLSDPIDTYGKEERGPGSNAKEELEFDAFTEVEEEQEIVQQNYFRLIQGVYNPYTHVLYMIFDNDLDLTKLKDINPDKAFISIGANRFYLHGATMSYYGIDQTKYNQWVDYRFPDETDEEDENAVTVRNQFDWTSHILEASLAQNEYSAINSYIDFEAPSLYITNVYENKIFYNEDVMVDFLVGNISLGGSDNYQIAWELDDNPTQYTTNEQVSIESLTNGLHNLRAYLVDENKLPLTNVEAEANVDFIYSEDDPYLEPHLAIKEPHGGQKLVSSTIGIIFEIDNFVISPNGNHVRYLLDKDVIPQTHYSEGTIILRDLNPGEHIIRLYLADAYGDEVVTDYGSATINFYIHNENAAMKVFVERSFIQGIESEVEEVSDEEQTKEEAFFNDNGNVTVNIANIIFSNVFCPLDVQFIAGESSVFNPSGEQTILIAKLRSQSSTYGLAENLPEANVDQQPTSQEMYGSIFLDGHAVVQLNSIGSMVFSNNAAKFAKTRSQALRFLGGAQKISDFHVLAADAVRKRAIISYTDPENEQTLVSWEYLSDRFVTDARSAPSQRLTIAIYNDRVEPSISLARRATTIIWENYSSNPVYIYSGETTSVRFNSDPDLTLYGDKFISPQLAAYQTGAEPARYALKFDNNGTFPYFVYPNIVEADVNGTLAIQENNSTNQSRFLIVENDPTSDFFGNRVVQVDMWGNVIWSFGEGMLYNPKDIREGQGGSYLISV